MNILRNLYRKLGLVHIDDLPQQSDLVRQEDLLALHRLQMATTARSYRLWEGNGRGASNAALNDLFFGLVRLTKPQLFVEAGAKNAETSIKMRDYLPDSEIVAFEASPVNYAEFSQNPALKEKKVDYRHSAVSDYDGEIEFYIRKMAGGQPVAKFSGANSILKRVAEDVEYEVVKSPCVRLDGVFPQAGWNAIWVDVEGATKQVLSGASSFLAKTNVAIVEVEDDERWKGQWTTAEVINYMFGFGLLPVARDYEYRGQYNIVFVNRECLKSNKDVWLNIEYYHSVLLAKG